MVREVSADALALLGVGSLLLLAGGAAFVTGNAELTGYAVGFAVAGGVVVFAGFQLIGFSS